MLFINAQTCIYTNGFTSIFVSITRSICQEFTIVPILYILQAEPLAVLIRNNPNTEGIKLPTKTENYIETKLDIFANDTQSFRSEKSIEESFKTLKLHKNASGGGVNTEKCIY